ncbi:hypothetical protein NOVOSPHI9U_70195 [Novosphingobium sp. 9U]|nr:hypothetical protein NOVOSPHI9U_70195 [Novosphingobium sp. 9U]
MQEAEFEAQGWSALPTRAFSATVGTIWARGEPGAR